MQNQTPRLPPRAKGGQTPRTGTVGVGPLMNLPELLRDLGHDPGPIIATAGFDLAEFANPDNKISYIRASRLLARCVDTTGYENLGLMLGKRVDPSALGIVGFMLKSAPDVGTALGDLVQHLDLHDQGAVLSLVTVERTVSLKYSIRLPGTKANGQIYDLSVTIACNIMRALLGNTWNPSKVFLSRRPPKDQAPYRLFFRAPVRFDANESALVFPEHWLQHPVETADPFLHQHLEKVASDLHDRQATTFLEHFRHLLLKSLSVRQYSIGQIAGQLGTRERTLNRRVRLVGTTYRRELDEIRYSIAQQLLGDTTMPLSKIATALDYSDPTAFSRAFRRWAAVTPSEWRSRHQSRRPGGT